MKPKVEKYTLISDNKIIKTEEGTFFIKPKKRYDIEQVYKYLSDHYVTNYLRPFQIREDKIIYPYLEESTLSLDERAKKLVYNLSLWHNKTTIHSEVDLDDLKERYEKEKEQLRFLWSYYHDLQDMVESKVYMLSTEYLFIRNVSIIYQALMFGEHTLENWYNLMKEKKTRRQVYCHGSCSLDHFLPNDNGYFIRLEQAHIGEVTEDIVNLLINSYDLIDLYSTYHFYQHKYPFTKEEELFFKLKVTMPSVVEIYPSNLKKSKELLHFFDRLKKMGEFILEQEQKQKKA